MASPDSPDDQVPHPEALARLFLEHGDVRSTLELCEIWRRREPESPRLAEIEAKAREKGVQPSVSFPLPIDESMAERYLLAGYVEEALFIYQRLVFSPTLDAEIQDRIRLLGDFLAFEIPDPPEPLIVRAERLIVERRLAVALIVYHELAEGHPGLDLAAKRRDQLRALLGEIPLSARLGTKDLYDTFDESPDEELGRDPAQTKGRPRPRGRFPAKTERDVTVPTAVRQLEEVPTVQPSEGGAISTQDDSEWVDPLEDTQVLQKSEVSKRPRQSEPPPSSEPPEPPYSSKPTVEEPVEGELLQAFDALSDTVDALSKTMPTSEPPPGPPPSPEAEPFKELDDGDWLSKPAEEDDEPADALASTDRVAFDLEEAKIQAEAHGVLLRQIHVIKD